MTTQHIVKQGDYLTKIAAQYGFADYKPIWDYGENAQLKQKRGNPNVLYPGDVLVIPEQKSKEETVATGQRHRIRVKQLQSKLRLQLRDVNDQPVVDKECKLVVELESFDLTTDGGGCIEQTVSVSAKKGMLSFDNMDVPLQIGALDPVDVITGQQARLANLGYYFGPIDGKEGALFQLAVEEFQCEHKLPVDGVCDANTQEKLIDEHGC